MNRTLAAAFAALMLAGPYAAAQENLKLDLPGKLDIPRLALTDRGLPPQEAALERTLTAMNDGNEMGMQVVEHLQSAGVKVVFRKQAALSAIESKPGAKPVIVLSDALPAYPRVLASYLTREASKLMLDAMVDSAEKEYMKLSTAVRVWLELGGSPKALPVIEPLNKYADKELADTYELWLQDPGSETALDRVGRKTGTEIIPVLQDKVAAEIRARKPGDPSVGMLQKLQAGLEEDNRRFVTFLLAEHEWRKANDFRLR